MNAVLSCLNRGGGQFLMLQQIIITSEYKSQHSTFQQVKQGTLVCGKWITSEPRNCSFYPWGCKEQVGQGTPRISRIQEHIIPSQGQFHLSTHVSYNVIGFCVYMPRCAKGRKALDQKIISISSRMCLVIYISHDSVFNVSSPGNLLKLQIFRLHLRPKSGTLGRSPDNQFS